MLAALMGSPRRSSGQASVLGAGLNQNQMAAWRFESAVRIDLWVDRVWFGHVAKDHIAICIGNPEHFRVAHRARKFFAVSCAMDVCGGHVLSRGVEWRILKLPVSDLDGHRVDRMARGLRFRNLTEINTIRQSVKHAKNAGWKAVVEYHLILLARFKLIEHSGRTLRPVFHLRPRNQHRAHGNWIQIEFGHVLDSDIPFGHVLDIFWLTASTGRGAELNRVKREQPCAAGNNGTGMKVGLPGRFPVLECDANTSARLYNGAVTEFSGSFYSAFLGCAESRAAC